MDGNEKPKQIKVGEKKSKVKKSAAPTDDFGLGVAQIVITAATPMEEIERPFPGEDDETEEVEETDTAQTGNEVETKSTEEVAAPCDDTIKQPEPEDVKPTEEVDEKSIVDDLPADSAPFPVSSSSGSEADSTSGPSTADNSTSLPSRGTVIEMQMENETSDEQPEIIPEKMLIGGRASIPDELQPDQLEKLQNLKESNA